jgi:hypothetical protein
MRTVRRFFDEAAAYRRLARSFPRPDDPIKKALIEVSDDLEAYARELMRRVVPSSVAE